MYVNSAGGPSWLLLFWSSHSKHMPLWQRKQVWLVCVGKSIHQDLQNPRNPKDPLALVLLEQQVGDALAHGEAPPGLGADQRTLFEMHLQSNE